MARGSNTVVDLSTTEFEVKGLNPARVGSIEKIAEGNLIIIKDLLTRRDLVLELFNSSN